ncbi:vacuolar protein sorting-associated protein 41 homolog [Chrysoperla carnea]|uniref:vacuolar protein sorting-associated protein 41 homolog n=1 Tax=Chrysoperla carnea TaxID=189513 RepID=UPI001D0911C8|nr:vacuolar protein sorting-associated protein 41 homolog [Chrysoperla carnea]
MSTESTTESDNNQQDDSDNFETEEVEPKLKYVRMANDLQNILLKDAASCIAVHPKFVCVGTHWGVVHLLDHQGDNIKCKELNAQTHSISVNQISIDSIGEHIATCSDDGKVFVYGLYSRDNNNTINTGRCVKCVAIDPNFSRNFRFITGDERLTLYEKSFLNRLKSTVLCESEGFVRNIAWNNNGQFVAWASAIGIRVYDLYSKCSLGLIKWENPNGLNIDNFRCNLRWSDQRTLLIGWIDTVRICVIRKRTYQELQNKDLPEYRVDPVTTFQTDFYISGIAPLDHQLVLLGLNKDKDIEQKSFRPQLYIVEYTDHDYIEICTDCLTLRGYRDYNCNDYYLDVLIEENRFFIVSPKDIVIASPYDIDDRIQWLINHNKFEDAMDALCGSHDVKRYDMVSLGKLYLDYLLGNKEFDKAGKLCSKIFGKTKNHWEEEIYKFASLHQLRSVSSYIPRSKDCKLNPHVYEMVLYEFLKYDAKGFLELVKEWNPILYNTSAVINAVLEHLLVCDKDKNTLLEALAMLYSYEGKYDNALSTYLKIKHKDVFQLIQKHNLYNNIQDKIVDLMDLDSDKTIALCLEKNRIPAHIVVEKLKKHDLLLYRYLHKYNKKDNKGTYHAQLVRLYAIFARDKLLPLLKSSDSYPIQEAFEICQKEKYFPEMVHLLGRIGNTKEALELIITKLCDMNKAINFCQEQNDQELWNDLINYSLTEPKFITFLLQRIGTYVDPRVLVERIENGKIIPGLKDSLVKMLCDYNLQVSVQNGCKRILMRDYFNLHDKLVNFQQKGVCISDENMCSACRRQVIFKSSNQIKPLVLYNCRHTFHEECLPSLAYLNNCGICYAAKK